MRRIIAAASALAVLVAGSYLAASHRTRPAKPPEATTRQEVAPQAEELNRLIEVFEGRTHATVDPLNLATLGGYYLERARLNGDVPDYRKAASALESAVDLAPRYRDASRRLAAASLALHRFQETLRLTEDLLSQEPRDPDALVLRSDALAELGRLDAARKALDSASLLVGGDPAVTVRHAALAHLNGEQARAIDLAAEAREEAVRREFTGRSLAFYFVFHADLLTDAGRVDEAHRLTERAVAIAPTWAEARAALAGALTSLGRFGDAIDGYTLALTLRPGDPDWLSSRSSLYAAVGRCAESERDLAAALALWRSDDPVIYGRSLARALADRNLDIEESVALAAADFERRRDPAAHDTYAWALYRAARYDEAAEVIRPVIESGLQDAEARFHAGLIMAAAGAPDLGRELLQGVVATTPSFHPLLAAEATAMLSALGS